MTCSPYRVLLCAYRDGELDDPDRRSLEEHLAACPECRGELEKHRCIAALLLGLSTPQDSPEPGPVILSLHKSDPSAEQSAMDQSLTRNDAPHILLVSQKVKDIKLPFHPELARQMAELRRLLRERSFIPGDKVPATLIPLRIKPDGVVVATLKGQIFSRFPSSRVVIEQEFKLFPSGYDGPLDVESIFASAPGARLDCGGNVQNMIVNLALAVLHASEPAEGRRLRMTIASSSDPFEGMPDALAASLREKCEIFRLDIPDRVAIHVPWAEDDQAGTLAITSEPERTDKSLERLIVEHDAFRKAFRGATAFVSTDPIYDQLRAHARPPFSTVINASTAFRALVASESYSRAVLLPMNNEEAGDVCKLLLQRGLEQELAQVARPPFPSPLNTSGEEIDAEALAELNNSLGLFMTYVPLRHPSLTCPITFGANGGLIIGAGQETLACFTSTPSSAGEKHLLEQFGDPGSIVTDRKFEAGAGDAAASIVAFFNTVDPRLFVRRPMEGREKEDRLLSELATAIFVCSLSRIAGNFVIRTSQTNWSNIDKRAFSRLLSDVASEALQLARSMVKKVHGPVLGELKKWGIKVVVWKPTAITYGGRESA